jgi:hypothetical protein
MSQLFEQALEAQLMAIPELMALLGTQAIVKTGIPQTWDLGVKGPVLTYMIVSKPRGQVLGGASGVAVARVQLDAWAYTVAAPKLILEAIFNGLNGVPGVWGDGSCVILSVVQADESDLDEPPKAGSDQWTYHSFCEYMIKYRVAIPTLS